MTIKRKIEDTFASKNNSAFVPQMVDVFLVWDPAHFCPVGLVQDISNGPSQRELEVPVKGMAIVSKLDSSGDTSNLMLFTFYLT